MPHLRPDDLRKMKLDELQGRLAELRAELIKLKSAAARGMLKKETGDIRKTRRNIARIMTVLNERRTQIYKTNGRSS